MTQRTCHRCGRTYGDECDARMTLLADTLEVSVFMAQDECSKLPLAEIADAARAYAEVIAAHGDDLQFGGKHCASTHAALARGLAALSFLPGGVVFLGRHWCATHPSSAAPNRA